MKTLLDLFEAGLSSIPTIGMWESEKFDFTNFREDEQIKEHYLDWASGDYIILADSDIGLLVEAFKAYSKESEERSFVNESKFHEAFGSKLENIELKFK